MVGVIRSDYGIMQRCFLETAMDYV